MTLVQDLLTVVGGVILATCLVLVAQAIGSGALDFIRRNRRRPSTIKEPLRSSTSDSEGDRAG